jgi:hypothetical protein
MKLSMRKLLVNASVTLISLLLAFAVCEAVVRTLYKDETVLFPRYHTDYRYGRYLIRGIRPNSTFRHTSVDGSWEFVTNSRGFRNHTDFPYTKPAGTFRVLSLGDSHTQGYEARQDSTFSAVLERFLAHRGIKAEVLNAGVSGFGTAEALALLENEGYRYTPDVVLLGFYANDFEDNLKAGLFGLDGQGRLVEEKFEHVPGVRVQNLIYALPPVRWLGENSYFYSLLFNTVWNTFKARLGEAALRKAGGPDQPGGKSVDDVEYAVPTVATLSPRQVDLAGALIERMHRFCRDRGIRFIVVDIPTRPAPFRFASSLPSALVERLKRAGIEYVASESVLSGLDGAVEFHAPHGHHHVSELTHALIAAEIGHRLRAAGPSP